MDGLKNCPWCGGVAAIVTLRKENYGYWPATVGAKCLKCKTTRGNFAVSKWTQKRGHYDVTEEAWQKAIAIWNKRSEPTTKE